LFDCHEALKTREANTSTPPNCGPVGATVRPNWFSRNWKWAVPVGILLLFLLAASFIGAVFVLVETSFQHSDFYAQALVKARANPRVAEKMGRPLTSGWLASGNLNESGPSGDVDLSFPLSGPKGKGALHLVAKKSAGVWKLETLQVEVAGEAERIDLLQPEENGSGG
jgi:hypothetical protein